MLTGPEDGLYIWIHFKVYLLLHCDFLMSILDLGINPILEVLIENKI